MKLHAGYDLPARELRLNGSGSGLQLGRTVRKIFVAIERTFFTYKFKSPSQRGVADRIVCLPDGRTWFVELKKEGGRLSELQKLFATDMERMKQRYACLWSKEMIDQWVKGLK
mgnify:CR=1 FL=1